MNQDNYCSLEAAQRLVDAGIVLDTECFYDLKSELHLNRGMTGKRLVREGCLPAPCFAELWRELPEKIVGSDGVEYLLSLDKTKVTTTGVVVTTACYEDVSSDGYTQRFFAKANPADALAELLIWVKGQEEGKCFI